MEFNHSKYVVLIKFEKRVIYSYNDKEKHYLKKQIDYIDIETLYE